MLNICMNKRCKINNQIYPSNRHYRYPDSSSVSITDVNARLPEFLGGGGGNSLIFSILSTIFAARAARKLFIYIYLHKPSQGFDRVRLFLRADRPDAVKDRHTPEKTYLPLGTSGASLRKSRRDLRGAFAVLRNLRRDLRDTFAALRNLRRDLRGTCAACESVTETSRLLSQRCAVQNSFATH
jgi:hypothetical protein